MIRLFSLLTFLSLSSLCSAQLINDGGTITIQSGATLYVETDVTNNIVGPSTGTINIEGTLEVQGDLTNNGTINTIAGSLLRFSGDQASDFLSSGDLIENMQMAKDDATNGTVTLTDNLTINTNLDFEPSSNGNKLILGTHNLSLAQQTTTVTDGTTNDYIVADGTGVVEKTVDADAIFFFPVGDLNAYSPIEVDYTANSYTNATISVNLDDVVHPNKPTAATDFIERYWNVDQSGIANYSATLTGTYDASDVTGTAGDVMGASQDNGAVGMEISDWSFDGSSNAANQVSADVDDSADLTGLNFFGKADLKVFLSGPFNGTTMSTTLAGLPSFPTSTPYDVAPWNAPTETIPGGTPPANTTDWILIEARDVNNPSTILGQKSAFVLNDGSIVGLDGGDLYIKDADPSSIIRIRHRNHLGVRTDAGYDMIASPLFDYTNGHECLQ